MLSLEFHMKFVINNFNWLLLLFIDYKAQILKMNY